MESTVPIPNVIQNYVNAATYSYSLQMTKEYLAVAGKNLYVPVNLQPRFWFNPDLRSTRFLIPGLMGMILIITADYQYAFNCPEKERGTIEQINVSPLSSIEFILGKTIPYIVISLINATIVLLAGYILFGIVIKGNILLLLLGTFAFLFAALRLGRFYLYNIRFATSCISSGKRNVIAAVINLIRIYIPDRKHADCHSDTNQYYSGKILYRYSKSDSFERSRNCRFLGTTNLPRNFRIHLHSTGDFSR